MSRFAEPTENDVKKTMFPSLEGEYVEEVEYEDDGTSELECVRLQDLGGDEYYEGKPILSVPYSFVVDEDGEEVKKYKCTLKLVDYESGEYLLMNINLKSDNDIQENVHGKSTLFAFIGSLTNLESKGWTDRNNRIKKLNLKEYRDFINELGSMTIKSVEHEPINVGGKPWYNFIVTEVGMD